MLEWVAAITQTELMKQRRQYLEYLSYAAPAACLWFLRSWWPAIGFVVIMAIVMAASLIRVAAARRAGLLPAAGNATMADVERLFRSGHRIWAIRCYREIHPEVMLREAKRIVEGMQTAA
jgi:hypothetical protein